MFSRRNVSFVVVEHDELESLGRQKKKGEGTMKKNNLKPEIFVRVSSGSSDVPLFCSIPCDGGGGCRWGDDPCVDSAILRRLLSKVRGYTSIPAKVKPRI